MEKSVRAVDGGGNGFRKADIYGTEARNLVCTKPGQITTPSGLVAFSSANLPAGNQGIAYTIAGDAKDGIMIKSSQIHWLDGVSLAALTSHAAGCHADLFNDMDGAVAGMARLVPIEPYFAGITWSSGLGIRVWKHKGIMAPCEGGHMPLDPSPFASLCGCGLRGCVESVCGGERVKQRIIAETACLGITIPKNMHPCRFLDQSFDKQMPWAVGIYDMVALGMGTFLASLQTLMRLPLVIWKGTFAKNALSRIEERIRYDMRRKLMNASWEADMEFLFSPEPEKDALIGAAALLLKQL